MTNKKHLTLRALCVSVLTATALFSSGCASIVHGGQRNITINSTPSGAKVVIIKADTGLPVHNGVTPLTVSLDPKRGYFKGQAYTLKVELEGYNSAEVAIKPELSGWFFGNILFGGLIGMLAVDPATGAMWNLTPDKIEQPLSANQASVIKNGEGFVVVLASQLTENERANMVRVN